MKTIKTLALTILLGVSTAYAQELNSDKIINKMIKAYGGQENLKQVNDYKQLWHIETKVSDKNGTDSREVMLPSYLYTSLSYPHKSEVRILDKGIGIKIFGEKTIEAKGPMLDAMKVQLMRLFSPLELKKRIKNIVISLTPTYYVLSLSEDGLTAEYFVSKKSFLIEKVIGRLQMGTQSMEFLTLYQDYKLVHGVMMPHKEIKYAGSVNTAIMRLQITKFKHTNTHSKFIKFKTT